MISAAPAAAQSGNGAYAPFPTPAKESATSTYYGRLGLNTSPAGVRPGAFPGGLAAAASTAGPTLRAGLGDGGSGVPALLAVLTVALLAVAAATRGRVSRQTA